MKAQEKNIEQVSRRNKFIFTGLWGFVFGVLIATFVFIPPLVSLLIIFVAFAVFFLERHAIILIALIAFALGTLRFEIKDFHTLVAPGDVGVVVSEVEYRDLDTRFVVKTNTGEKVLVSTDLLSEVKYGDEVKLLGQAKTLKPGGYANYLSKDDIFYTMNFAKVEVLSSGNGNKVKSALLKVKSVLVERVRSILPEPEASLLAGLIVSGKQALPVETLDEFKRAGVVHIVVLSGYNITIIAEFLFAFFGFLSLRSRAGISLIGVAMFTLMAGAPATVLRGAIMVMLLMLGKIFGREGSAPRILLFTAVVMVMINPKILVYDPSFHLSFLAMLGIIYGVPIVRDWLAGLGSIPTWLIDILATTLATQIFVFPYLLYNMGNFSTVFLLANLAVLLVIPFTMLSGFLATILAFISTILAWPLTFIAHLLLVWILAVASFLGNLPFASLEIESFPLWVTLILYICLGVIVWRLRNSSPRSPSLG